MRKTIAAISLCLILLMAGIALGRWSLLGQGILIKGEGRAALEIVPLSLSAAEPMDTVVVRTININQATAEELTELPGIGQAIAQRIVEYRMTYGEFQSTEELMAVRGVGEGIFSKLSPYITIK